jgi:hypothetical protein
MKELGSLESYIARVLRSAGGAFCRLLFIASLRDAYSGRYLHEGWGQVASPDEIHSALVDIHRTEFLSVLRLGLLDLSRHLRRHFQSIHEREGETALLWLETEPYRNLVPQGCSPTLRELFFSQVRTALEVLYRSPDWQELSEPIASPPPPPDRLHPRQSLD